MAVEWVAVEGGGEYNHHRAIVKGHVVALFTDTVAGAWFYSIDDGPMHDCRATTEAEARAEVERALGLVEER